MRDRVIRTNIGNEDGIDRRGFLKCMAWAGTGVLWTISGGILKSAVLPDVTGTRMANAGHLHAPTADFTFVQISDSHIGFTKEANPDVTGTLQTAIAKINALNEVPSFMLHTGDLTHLSKASEFDTLDQVLKSAVVHDIFYVPGEHDVLAEDGKQYFERYSPGSRERGWYSFDAKGIHFVGLVNVLNLKPGGLGYLGDEQLHWLEADLSGRSASTPIVVFAHVPLWAVYPEWGWGTDDGTRVVTLLKRFGSATVLNGHIHQTMQKVEGTITFHTAMSTAFPQPAPGTAPSPGPMKVPIERLRSLLGLTAVNIVEGSRALALIDDPLSATTGADADTTSERRERVDRPNGPATVDIDNFSFTPKTITVARGEEVTWTNHDDVPHTVVSTTRSFSSPVLDTNDHYGHIFNEPGRFDYFCSLHPRMTGTVNVAKSGRG